MIKLTPELAKKLILSAGTRLSNRPLSPIEVASAMKQAKENGMTTKELADALYFEGTTMIGRYIKLLSLSTQIQPLIGWGSDASTLSFSTASEIARLTPNEQTIFSRAVLSHQLGLSEVKQIVQIRQRLGKAIEQAIQAVLDQRTVVIQRHVIVGAVMAEDLRRQLAQMTQEERNTLLRQTLEKRGPGFASIGAKLGPDNFTLVGDKQFQKAITSLPNGFEEAITQYLQQELHNKG
jgi:hypothetical protein